MFLGFDLVELEPYDRLHTWGTSILAIPNAKSLVVHLSLHVSYVGSRII